MFSSREAFQMCYHMGLRMYSCSSSFQYLSPVHTAVLRRKLRLTMARGREVEHRPVGLQLRGLAVVGERRLPLVIEAAQMHLLALGRYVRFPLFRHLAPAHTAVL